MEKMETDVKKKKKKREARDWKAETKRGRASEAGREGRERWPCLSDSMNPGLGSLPFSPPCFL